MSATHKIIPLSPGRSRRGVGRAVAEAGRRSGGGRSKRGARLSSTRISSRRRPQHKRGVRLQRTTTTTPVPQVRGWPRWRPSSPPTWPSKPPMSLSLSSFMTDPPRISSARSPAHLPSSCRPSLSTSPRSPPPPPHLTKVAVRHQFAPPTVRLPRSPPTVGSLCPLPASLACSVVLLAARPSIPRRSKPTPNGGGNGCEAAPWRDEKEEGEPIGERE